MKLHDLFWLDAPASPRAAYHHNVLALLVFVFGVVPAFGGFGYATLTIGPSFLRLEWLIPGVIVWSAALYYVLSVMRRRSEPEPRIEISDGYRETMREYAAPVCTHEYPNGAVYCIYCGERRIPVPATVKL